MSEVGRAGLTVITWNAQGSHGMNVPAVAAALMAHDPDLVLLQEVQRRQLGELHLALRATDARWRFKHWGVTIPAEGLGVVSMVPLDRVHHQVLAHRWQFWNWRRRVAIHFGVEVGGVLVRCIDVHLGAGVPHSERVRQARELLRAAPNAGLIAGDLNAEPGSHELSVFAEGGWRDAERRIHGDTARPSTNWAAGPRTQPPTQRLDYLLVPDAVEVLEAFVPDDWPTWALLSDHVPVVARLRFARL